jgi:hypothetical protein
MRWRPHEYRARLFGRPLGDWRPTREEAREDARRAGEGYRGPYDGVVFLSPGVEIESRPL